MTFHISDWFINECNFGFRDCFEDSILCTDYTFTGKWPDCLSFDDGSVAQLKKIDMEGNAIYLTEDSKKVVILND